MPGLLFEDFVAGQRFEHKALDRNGDRAAVRRRNAFIRRRPKPKPRARRRTG